MTQGNEVSAEFIAEAQEIVDALNRDLIATEQETRGGEPDPARVNNLFRSAHSLKGISGMFGADAIARLAHALENVLDGMRLGKVNIDAASLDILFGCVEHFSLLIAAASTGEKTDDAPLQQLMTKLEHLAGGEPTDNRDPLALLELGEDVMGVLTEYEEHRLRENIRRGRRLYLLRSAFDLTDFDLGLAELDNAIKQLGEVITKLPSSQATDPGKISFDIIVGSDQSIETLRRAVGDERTEIVAIQHRAMVAAPPESTPRLPTSTTPSEVSAAPVSVSESSSAASGTDSSPAAVSAAGSMPPGVGGDETTSVKSVSQTVRVDIARLDRLMNLVGELSLTKVAFQHIGDSLKRDLGFTGLAAELHKVSRDFERRLSELQAGIMEVRMVPLGNLFERMVRVGRKTGRELGRMVRMEVAGESTELDKLIVEDLADPLMHLIRNAIDHGIELPEERERLGKPAEGLVRLEAQALGNHVVVRVVDDGRGVDVERIVARAVERGLETPERARELTRREVFNLMFLPGFSTRDQVSDFSGRGVGLDVVKTNISELSGIIETVSVSGGGTTFTITLPITLAIIPALIVSVAARNYAIPLNNVQETLAIDARGVKTIERREVISVRGTTVPLIDLRRLFRLDEDGRPSSTYGVIAGVGDNRMALVVDTLVGQQDIVIKSLGRYLRNVRGIAGATELGDQRTILVIDTVDLLNELTDSDRFGGMLA